MSSTGNETGREGQLPSLFQLLKAHNLFPTQSLGQVFLTEPKVINLILDTLRVQPDDLVVEIGAGPGIITRQLAEQAGRLVANEIDKKFKPLHEQLFSDLDRPPEMIYQDAKKVDYHEVLGEFTGRLRVFGNLPYYLTTDLILTSLSRLSGMSMALFMVESEVSERMEARPGNKKYGVLSMASQLFGQWKRIRTVSRTAFFPKPRVTSALMSLTPSDDLGRVRIASDPGFHRFLTGLMQYRRKTLLNSLKLLDIDKTAPALSLDEVIQSLGHGPAVRAEQLEPHELGALYQALGLSDPS